MWTEKEQYMYSTLSYHLYWKCTKAFSNVFLTITKPLNKILTRVAKCHMLVQPRLTGAYCARANFSGFHKENEKKKKPKNGWEGELK